MADKNVPAPTLKQSLEAVRSGLEMRKKDLSDLLGGSSLTADQFIRGVVLACTKNTKLALADRTSLFRSAMLAAENGWSVSGGPLAKAHLVPFNNTKAGIIEVQMIPDWKGLADAAMRSGYVDSLWADDVREGDEFSYEQGTGAYLRHKQAIGRMGKATIAAYAIAYLKGSSRPVFVVLEKDAIEYHRAFSKQSDGTTWTQHYGRMARKSAVRELWPFLPTTPKMEKAFEADVISDSKSPIDVEANVSFVSDPEEPQAAQQPTVNKVRDAITKGAAKAAAQPAPAGATPAKSDEDPIPDWSQESP